MNDCPITQRACYAVAGENRLPDTRRKNIIVQNLINKARNNNMLGAVFNIAELYITESLKTKKPIKYIRFNEAGDFPNQQVLEYAAKFAQHVKKNYGVISMAYTAKKGIDPSVEINGEPIDMIMAINRSRNDIPKSANAINRNYYGIEMGNFSANPNVNLENSYCDVEYVTNDDVNNLKVATPLKDELGSPSIPVLNKGSWQGGSGYYYVCPCSFWQYNKDKAILQFAVENGIVDSNYPIPQTSQDRKKIKGFFNDEQWKRLSKILNKIKSPCGTKCSVCHDTKGGVYGEREGIKDYSVLAATHGTTASNYDAKYAELKRQGRDSEAVYKGDTTNPNGRERKYKTKAPINSDLFQTTNEEKIYNIVRESVYKLLRDKNII